jgi:hypothetical protein
MDSHQALSYIALHTLRIDREDEAEHWAQSALVQRVTFTLAGAV